MAQPGELDAEGRAKARGLARSITGRGDEAELFGVRSDAASAVPVRLNTIRLERGRTRRDTQEDGRPIPPRIRRGTPIGHPNVP